MSNTDTLLANFTLEPLSALQPAPMPPDYWNRIEAAVRPWSGPLDQFLEAGAIETSIRNIAYAFVMSAGTATVRRAERGEPCLFWTGSELTIRPFEPAFEWLQSFRSVLNTIPAEVETIVDLGSGNGMFSLLAASERPGVQIINVDREPHTLALNKILAEKFGLADRIRQIAVDLTLKLPHLPVDRAKTAVVSFQSIYTDDMRSRYAELMPWLQSVGHMGGHFEMLGHWLPEYRVICQQCGTQEMPLNPKVKPWEGGDPLPAIKTLPNLRGPVLAPQFISTVYFGLFSWKAS